MCALFTIFVLIQVINDTKLLTFLFDVATYWIIYFFNLNLSRNTVTLVSIWFVWRIHVLFFHWSEPLYPGLVIWQDTIWVFGTYWAYTDSGKMGFFKKNDIFVWCKSLKEWIQADHDLCILSRSKLSKTAFHVEVFHTERKGWSSRKSFSTIFTSTKMSTATRLATSLLVSWPK